MQINIPSNLQASIKQVRPAPNKENTKYYVGAITFNLSNNGNHLWNDMITVLSANFSQVSSTPTEFWCKLNHQFERKTNKGKQNDIRWCQQCNKPGEIGRIEHNLLKGYELRKNYVKNTTSVSSCDLEQVTPTKYPNQKYV